MLQTDFPREMPRSGSFAGGRGLPRPFGVKNPDDFGKTFVLVRSVLSVSEIDYDPLRIHSFFDCGRQMPEGLQLLK